MIDDINEHDGEAVRTAKAIVRAFTLPRPEDHGQSSEHWYTGHWIQTYTGRRFELFAPTPDMIDVRDIAHALAQQCRYNGHTPTHYSVAQHSVLASLHVAPIDVHEESKGSDDHNDPILLRRWALLHDASEAYTGDLVRPLKQHPTIHAVFKAIESKIQAAICDRFGLPHEEPAAVKLIDRRLCVTEKRDVLRQSLKADDAGIEPLHATIKPCSAVEAEIMFRRSFDELFG